MADRIDPVTPLRLTGTLSVRPLAAAPRIASADIDARAADRLDSFQFSRAPRPTKSASGTLRDSTMVAATVPGRIDFTADSHSVPSSGLPMYRHPADRNAAATAVDAGRRLDVEG